MKLGLDMKELSIGIIGAQFPQYIEGTVKFSDHHKLDHLRWDNKLICDLSDRANNNRAYQGGCTTQGGCLAVITKSEYNELIAANKKAKKNLELKKLKEEIHDLERNLKNVKRDQLVATQKEAQKQMKHYNDVHNEGCEGYVPWIMSQVDYDYMVNQLAAKKAELANH